MSVTFFFKISARLLQSNDQQNFSKPKDTASRETEQQTNL